MIWEPHERRRSILTALAATLLLLPACRSQSTESKPQATYGQSVHGKVTYKGKTVPFGYVVLYAMELSHDTKNNTFSPTGFAPIEKDGTYQISKPPAGPSMWCVVADPSLRLLDVIAPKFPGGRDLRQLGGPPGGGPPGGGPPGGGPPGGGPPGGGPPGGDPPGGDQPGGASHPTDHGFMDPRAQDLNLSEDQKKMLKAVTEKYGVLGKSPLAFPIKEGADETINLELD